MTNYKQKIENYLQLDSAKSYQFTIYHFNPELMGFRSLRLLLKTDPNSIEIISEDYFEFTSSYDDRRFEIYTKRIDLDKFSYLVLKSNNEKILIPQISIPIVVRYNRFYSIGTLVLAGLGVFSTGLSTNIKTIWQVPCLLVSAFFAALGLFLKTRKD